MRLIDKDALKVKAEHIIGVNGSSDAWRILSEIDNAKEIDAEPVRHGKWLRTGRTNVYGGFEVECSVCNDNVMITNNECEHYCRKCGARMDGE